MVKKFGIFLISLLFCAVYSSESFAGKDKSGHPCSSHTSKKSCKKSGCIWRKLSKTSGICN